MCRAKIDTSALCTAIDTVRDLIDAAATEGKDALPELYRALHGLLRALDNCLSEQGRNPAPPTPNDIELTMETAGAQYAGAMGYER